MTHSGTLQVAISTHTDQNSIKLTDLMLLLLSLPLDLSGFDPLGFVFGLNVALGRGGGESGLLLRLQCL
jgi:hypothetical protein